MRSSAFPFMVANLLLKSNPLVKNLTGFLLFWQNAQQTVGIRSSICMIITACLTPKADRSTTAKALKSWSSKPLMEAFSAVSTIRMFTHWKRSLNVPISHLTWIVIIKNQNRGKHIFLPCPIHGDETNSISLSDLSPITLRTLPNYPLNNWLLKSVNQCFMYWQ